MIALDLLRAGAVTVVATPGLLLLRRASGRVRHAAFAAALAASAVAPFAVGLVPQRVLAYTPPLPQLGHAPGAVASVASTAASVPVGEPGTGNREPIRMPSWLIFLPALVPLGRMAFGWRTARRWVRHAVPGPDGALLSPDATVPMTFFDGFHRILLPEAARDWSPERLNAVLLHERAHVRRGDWWTQTAARTIVAFQWMNPLAWWMLRGLVDAAEEAADEATLRGGVAPQTYARELLSLALPGLRPVGTLPMTPRTDIGRRVVVVLKGPRPVAGWKVALAALAPLSLIIPAASIGCAPAFAQGFTRPSTPMRQEGSPSDFGNEANGWNARFSDGRKAKLAYVVGWFGGKPRAWKPDGTSIPLTNLPIGPVTPAPDYDFDSKTKKWVKSGKPTPNERMFVVGFDDPTGVMEAGSQSASSFQGPARATFGRGSWTTNPGQPGTRYTSGFIAYTSGFGDIKGVPVYRSAVGFACGPSNAHTILTLSAEKGLSVPAEEAANQKGVSFNDGYDKKPALTITVSLKKEPDTLQSPWLVAVGYGKDGKIDTESPVLLHEGPKGLATPFYRYSLPRPRAAYEKVEILAGATTTTEFDGVAIMPDEVLKSERAKKISAEMSNLLSHIDTLSEQLQKSTDAAETARLRDFIREARTRVDALELEQRSLMESGGNP